jgi:hypothetical protein
MMIPAIQPDHRLQSILFTIESLHVDLLTLHSRTKMKNFEQKPAKAAKRRYQYACGENTKGLNYIIILRLRRIPPQPPLRALRASVQNYFSPNPVKTLVTSVVIAYFAVGS